MTFYPRSLALFWLALGRQLGRLGLYDESMNKRTTQTWGLNFFFSHLAMINYSEIQLRDDFASFSMLSSLCFFYCLSFIFGRALIAQDDGTVVMMPTIRSLFLSFFLSSFAFRYYDDGCDADLCILSGRSLMLKFNSRIQISASLRWASKSDKRSEPAHGCCQRCWWKLRRNFLGLGKISFDLIKSSSKFHSEKPFFLIGKLSFDSRKIHTTWRDLQILNFSFLDSIYMMSFFRYNKYIFI